MILNYPRLYNRFYASPLLIEESAALAIHTSLWPRMSSNAQISVSSEDIKAARATKMKTGMRGGMLWPDADGDMFTIAKPGVAVVPVNGVLGKNLDALDMMCGGVPVDAVRQAFGQAMANKDIKTIVLDFASPGGEVTGIEELGSTIREAAASSKKTIYAFTDSQCCSAAYWLASQCDEIVTTPSAILGSIGVYVAWFDPSVAMQLAGYQLQMFAAGEHKGMGMPGRALSQKERDLLQGRVDAVYQKFTTAVTSVRPGVAKGNMQGQTFTGEKSMSNGLADVLVNDWDEFIREV